MLYILKVIGIIMNIIYQNIITLWRAHKCLMDPFIFEDLNYNLQM